MIAMMKRLWTEEDGAGMVEYVIILALVVLATAAVFISEDSGLRPAIKSNFDAKAAPLNPAGS